MMGYATIRRGLLTAFALGMLVFGQLHAVVHVHHSHEDDFLPVEVSFHPVGVHAALTPDHHEHDGEEHHHQSDQDHARWFLARCHHARQTLPHSPIFVFVLPEIFDRLFLDPLSFEQQIIPLVEQSTRFKSDPRGPPIII